MAETIKTLSKQIHKILMEEWDPIGIDDKEALKTEYISYVPSLAQMVMKQRSVDEIKDHLDLLVKEMGMLPNSDHNAKIATRLLYLKTG